MEKQTIGKSARAFVSTIVLIAVALALSPAISQAREGGGEHWSYCPCVGVYAPGNCPPTLCEEDPWGEWAENGKCGLENGKCCYWIIPGLMYACYGTNCGELYPHEYCQIH